MSTSSTSASQSSTQSTASNVARGDVAALNDNVESHAETDDGTYDTTGAVAIALADGSSTVTGTGATVDGETVTISAPGTYLLTGSLSDGQIVVDSAAEGKVRLVLDGVTVTNSSGAAVAISAADEAVVILAEGSTNALTDGSGYDTSAPAAPNAALFSMADLTIAGSGALTVTGNTNDGIGSKDGLVILSADLTVTAQDDGLRGNDYVIIAGGTTTGTAQGDAVKSDHETADTVGYVAISDGTLTVTAGDDGIHAEGDLAVTGGNVTVSESSEGLEGATITLAGGSTTVTASDDGLNSSTGTSAGSVVREAWATTAPCSRSRVASTSSTPAGTVSTPTVP